MIVITQLLAGGCRAHPNALAQSGRTAGAKFGRQPSNQVTGSPASHPPEERPLIAPQIGSTIGPRSSARDTAPPLGGPTCERAPRVAIDSALGPVQRSERYVTAIHEAGHVWGYWSGHLTVVHVTVIPRPRAYRGMVEVLPRRVRWNVAACAAAAGPVAQAIHSMLASDPADGIGWVDHMASATIAGGAEDVEAAFGALDDSADPFLAFIRDQLLRDWPAVTALAVKLVREGTVAGQDAFEVLSRNGAHRQAVFA
jgi:hypothetical protein